MDDIDGRVPPGAREITTGQANRVWSVDGPTPYILKHYGDPGRAANETAVLRLLTRHRAPAPQLLAASSGSSTPPWTAQTALHGKPVPVDWFLADLAEPLAAIHRIPGSHFGRLAGAWQHRSWTDYLHDRLNTYATAAPALRATARLLHQEVAASMIAGIQPVLLHHDLQPGHLLRVPAGSRQLIDWELAIFGDAHSDLGRLAVRLDLDDPTPVLALAQRPDPTAETRPRLHWHIHLLADAALSTDPAVRERAARRLLGWG
ncbi:aminoglycoside phosphotransferase (APT) family kinase protein [Streptomyces sp. 2333.5]|nr:aminoglycoside phosphotransferase (APT) family kinase protein [Streptomyces sp. 2333.5]SEE29929.1 Predicted kinase, aminoglycoside phosphotransferase (APT) family [Streptomyces sp. 2314.4]SEE57049.1 Predicted kinase, aminoglycoside phosphotransferase (APT) family [Streptomyces sp. 2112.2]